MDENIKGGGTDRKILELKSIDEIATLKRVINSSGVPYSCIIINDEEMLSTPTSGEEKMIEYYKRNKNIYKGRK